MIYFNKLSFISKYSWIDLSFQVMLCFICFYLSTPWESVVR